MFYLLKSDCGIQLPSIAPEAPYSSAADAPEIYRGATTESLQNIREQNGLQSLLPVEVGSLLKHPPTSYEQIKTEESSGKKKNFKINILGCLWNN